MTQRPGVTLTEVLVAIFITGIGLISLLALFPLGAANMKEAIKDQRTADAARIANSLARAFNLRNDANVFPAYNTPGPAPTTGPSYMAYIDPQGFQVTGGGTVGGATGVNRVIPSATLAGNFGNAQVIQRWTTLQDEFNYDTSGAPLLDGGGSVQRTGLYSWAWFCQQNRASTTNPTPSGVNLTVVVYYRRPLTPSGSGLLEEVPCTANFNTGSNVATLSWSGTTPALKRGCWILDATTTPSIHGYFYRVVAVNPTGPNSADVELHMNARAGGRGTAIVMDSVVEVFEKGP